MTISKQAIFDKCVGGVIAQGGPSINPKGHCVYRGENGFKCSVGHAIPDKWYHPEMEDHDINFVLDTFPMPLYLKRGADILHSIQAAHDYAFTEAVYIDFITLFREEAKKTANRFHLKWNHDG